MTTEIITGAELEVARFLARQPSPEEILTFRLPDEMVARFYALVDAEREGKVTRDETRELDTFLFIDHMMRLVKAEVQRRLSQQAS